MAQTELGGCKRFPVLTATALTVAVAAAVVQYSIPSVVPLLQRDAAGLNGQWWRMATPLLVQTLGWYQVLANLVTLAFIGLVSEWLLNRWQWVVLLASGTLGGQIAAYAWHEPGGGDSIAISGLAGGTVIALLASGESIPRLAAHPLVYYIVALAGWGFGGVRAAGFAFLIIGIFLISSTRINGFNVERIALAGTVVGAVALASARDLHGVSLISGMAVMALILGLSAPRRPGVVAAAADQAGPSIGVGR